MWPVECHTYDPESETMFGRLLLLQVPSGHFSSEMSPKQLQSFHERDQKFRAIQREDHDLRKQVQQSSRKAEVLLKSLREESERTKLLEEGIAELRISLQDANARAVDVMEENHVLKSELARRRRATSSGSDSPSENDSPSSPLERQLFFAQAEDDKQNKITLLQAQVGALNHRLRDSSETIAQLNRTFDARDCAQSGPVRTRLVQRQSYTLEPSPEITTSQKRRRDAISLDGKSYLARSIRSHEDLDPAEPRSPSRSPSTSTSTSDRTLTPGTQRPFRAGTSQKPGAESPVVYSPPRSAFRMAESEAGSEAGSASDTGSEGGFESESERETPSSPPSLASSRSTSFGSLKSSPPSSPLRTTRRLPRWSDEKYSNEFLISSHPFPTPPLGCGL